MDTINAKGIADKVGDLPFQTINKITAEIARKTKKKRITSGSQSFKDYCNVIAENLVKENNRPVLEKFSHVLF